ncbi:MAG: class I SAM-dependent RNA methyltransferase [Chitinispirillaceae bacterium]
MKTVRIEKVVYGGAGLARGEEGVVFVPGTLPGELVRIEVDGSEGGAKKGRLVEVLEPSPFRRGRQCEYEGVCGGCDWMHIVYSKQIEYKKEVFLDCLSRIGHISDPPCPEAIYAREHGYRLRAQLKLGPQGAGFYRRKSNQVVKIDRCPLLVDELNALLKDINSGKATVPAGVKSLKAVVGGNVASFPVIQGLTHGITELLVGEKRFLVNGDSFFQSNRYLLNRMGTWASPHVKGDYCLDLYGGTGFFSVMLAHRFGEGVLVESVASQVKRAEENFRLNGIGHFRAVVGDVERGAGLDALVRKRHPDCIIVDPPRPGLVRRAREWLAGVSPPTILYISCNPSTFSRDANFFVNKCGYTFHKCALFDLYPNTHHIESAAVFRKRFGDT